MSDVKEHLERATDHLQLANQELEADGDKTAYDGEDHMTEALYQLRELAQARVAADD